MSSHGEIVTIDIRTFNDPSGDLAALLRRSPEHWLAVSSMFPSSPKPELACFPGIIPNQAVMVEDLRELYENSLSELPDGAVISEIFIRPSRDYSLPGPRIDVVFGCRLV